jgi:hypothetical protein
MRKRLRLSKPTFLLGLIVLLGLALRIYSIYPNNIILGFDQARDLFMAKTIFTHGDIKIIGPTAGNNTDLHHGIAWIYFVLPAVVVGGGNPFWVSLWNSLFNLLAVFIVYELARSFGLAFQSFANPNNCSFIFLRSLEILSEKELGTNPCCVCLRVVDSV